MNTWSATLEKLNDDELDAWRGSLYDVTGYSDQPQAARDWEDSLRAMADAEADRRTGATDRRIIDHQTKLKRAARRMDDDCLLALGAVWTALERGEANIPAVHPFAQLAGMLARILREELVRRPLPNPPQRLS